MYVFFQLIAFQMIYNTANYALDFDFCNEFTLRRQRKHVMNGKNQRMAKIKRAKEPHRATAAAAVVPAFATSVGPIFFSVTHTERTKQSESKNKTKKEMPLDSTRLDSVRVDGVRIYVRGSHILPFYQNPWLLIQWCVRKLWDKRQ